MGQGQGFGQIFIEAHDTGDSPCHLGHLNGMGKPGAVVVALMIHKNLGFMVICFLNCGFIIVQLVSINITNVTLVSGF